MSNILSLKSKKHNYCEQITKLFFLYVITDTSFTNTEILRQGKAGIDLSNIIDIIDARSQGVNNNGKLTSFYQNISDPVQKMWFRI